MVLEFIIFGGFIMSKKFYEQTWFIVLILIVFFPAGLVLVWTNKQWSQKSKIIATVIVAVLVILGLGGRGGSKANADTEEAVTEAVSETTVQEDADAPQLIDYKLVEQKDVGDKYTYRVVVDPSATEQQLLDVFKHLDTTSYEYAIAWFYSSEDLAYDNYDVAVIERTGDEEPVCTGYKDTTETVTQKETAATAQEETNTDMHETVRQLIENVSSTYFQDVTVLYDEEKNAFIVNVCQEGVAADLVAVKAGTLDRDTWDQVADTMAKNCSSMKELAETAELDSNVMLNILNDQNRDNILLSIINGTVIYNAADD